jgi:hypothetical protein
MADTVLGITYNGGGMFHYVGSDGYARLRFYLLYWIAHLLVFDCFPQ